MNIRATLELDPIKRPWKEAQAIFIGVMKEHANVPREAFDIWWVDTLLRVSAIPIALVSFTTGAQTFYARRRLVTFVVHGLKMTDAPPYWWARQCCFQHACHLDHIMGPKNLRYVTWYLNQSEDPYLGPLSCDQSGRTRNQNKEARQGLGSGRPCPTEK